MDQGGGYVREKNPRESASIFSIISFFYNRPIFKKGKKADLQEKDIYEVLPNYASEKLGNRLEDKWEKEKKDHTSPSVLRALFSCFGKLYCFLGVIQLLVRTSMALLQPIFFSKFVAYFQKDQTTLTKSDAYYYASLVIGLNLLTVIYNHNFTQTMTEFTIRVRTAICSLIYRKALRLGPTAFSDISMGKTVTLITKDVYSIDGALMFFNDMWIGAVQITVICYILYRRIGCSVFAAIAFFAIIIPVQVYSGKLATKNRLATAKKTDERLQLTQEALSAIKIVKMYIWENYFCNFITNARLKETDKLKFVYYTKAFILTLGGLTLKLSFFLLIMTYIWTGQYIKAETVYFIQNSLFNLRSALTISIPLGIAQTADCIAALKRIKKFLTSDELTPKAISKKGNLESPRVYLNDVGVEIKGKTVLESVSLNLEKGLLLVTGNVGSGKSSLLKTILGDYAIKKGKMFVHGSVSYGPEEPWLFPSTIRQNILFGQPYNERRYHEVLKVCALTYDLNQFEKGDNTIVGDRGINLSKGQQARINIARAVYKDSDIYLFDDCTSSLDTHVNKHVFKHCINGFLKDKLCILVTHNMNHICYVSGSILYIADGKTLSLDQQNNSLDKRITYFIDDDNKRHTQFISDPIIEEEEEEKDKLESDALLNGTVEKVPQNNLYHEVAKPGKVDLHVYLQYYKYTGGIWVLIFMFAVFFVCQIALAYSDKLVSLWVNVEPKITILVEKNLTNSTEFIQTKSKRNNILNIYTIMIIVGTLLTLFRSFSNFYFCTKAGRNLHNSLITSILNAVMGFFDSHFIGNIINRLSKDFHTIDEALPFVIYENFRSIFIIFGTLFLIASVNWMLLVPAIFLLIKLAVIRWYYTPTGRSLRRLEAATRSPMIGYLNATLEGLSIVRAYEQENTLKKEFDKHQDLFTSTFYMNQSTIRAFGFSLDIACFMFLVSIIIKFLMFPGGAEAGDVGLAVSQAMLLTGLLQYSIRQLAELENTMTSVERVLEYTEIETENKTGVATKNWPTNGTIEYQNVTLVYKTTQEKALKNVSFTIEGGSKVGIVGRTGAGKSSIISTLFRLYNVDGQITIDGVNIKNLELEFLRSKIGIIPQDPVLFTGTIRTNIDPLEKHSDAVIWEALEKVKMKSSISTLSQPITEKGSNYSAGQRQLICLARALVSKNKIIVLDEATANMDPETDALLQKSIKDNFPDCTVLTIAHRLRSVRECDKVLVVDSGMIAEQGNPNELLKNENGMFYRMVQHSGVVLDE